MQDGEGTDQPLSLREQWLNHTKARERLLDNAIRTVDAWVEHIADDDLGPIGKNFQKLLKKTGCHQKIDIYNTGCAHYVSFSYGHATGFVNHIIYGPAAEEDLSKLFSSKVHEATHALQKMRSAALHASPFNPNTQIVICPTDWLLLEERCEQDAYVKQALFNSLLARELPEVRRMTDNNAMSVKTFEKIRLESKSIEETLTQAALQALDKSFFWDNPQSEYKFKNHYHDFTLRNYENGIAARRRNGEEDIIFVRLEPEDIYAIGQSCGPNPFGPKELLPAFLEKPVLADKAREKRDEILKDAGIDDEDSLPTLGEILQRLGLTRKKFIEASYNRPLNIPAQTLQPV